MSSVLDLTKISFNHGPSKCEKHAAKHKEEADKHLKIVKQKVGLRASKITETSYSLVTAYPQLTSQVLDQGSLGSCVANSFCGIMWTTRGIMPSRLYVYFNCRVGTGECPNADSGLDLLQSAPLMTNFGLTPETTWAYDVNLFSQIPPLLAYQNAIITPPVTMTPISQTQESINQALKNKQFVIFGFYVYNSFMTSQVASNGVIPIPKSTEKILGGHCIHIVGWTTLNSIPYYIIRNSWGTSWGNDGNPKPSIPYKFKNNNKNGGFAYMPQSFVLDPKKSFEFIAVS